MCEQNLTFQKLYKGDDLSPYTVQRDYFIHTKENQSFGRPIALADLNIIQILKRITSFLHKRYKVGSNLLITFIDSFFGLC